MSRPVRSVGDDGGLGWGHAMFRLVAACLFAVFCVERPCLARANADRTGPGLMSAQGFDPGVTTSIVCAHPPCAFELPVGGNTAIFSAADRTKIVAEYGLDVRFVLIAADFSGSWDREQAMVGKMAEVRAGVSPAGKDAAVVRYSLVQAGGIEGYEYAIRTREGGRERWHLGLAGVGPLSTNSACAVSLVVEAGSTGARAMAESVYNAARASIRLQPARAAGPKTAAAGEEFGSDWEKARRHLVVVGVAGNGTNSHASVNGNVVRVGDVLSVRVDGQRYRFRVRGIDSAAGKVDFAPVRDR